MKSVTTSEMTMYVCLYAARREEGARQPKRHAGDRGAGRAYHVVISKATMISSLRTSAVKEMETMFRNSFSKSTREPIMMAAPANKKNTCQRVGFLNTDRQCSRTLVYADHQPLKEGLVREGAALNKARMG